MRDKTITNNNAEKMYPRGRMDSLQALRAFAFLGVFASHGALGDYGSWGVSVFLVLSGFLMVYSYIDREIPASLGKNLMFGIKKIKTLYPLHVIMTAVVLYVTAAMGGRSVFGTLLNNKRDVLLNLLLVQAWVPRPEIHFSLNSVAWYLSVSFFAYAMFPWIIKRIKGYKSIKSAVVAIIVTYTVMGFFAALTVFVPVPAEIFPNLSKWFTYVFPLFRLGDFIIGCNLGYIFLNNPIKLTTVWATLLEFFTLAALWVTQFIHSEQIIYIGGEWFRHTLLYIPTSMLLVYLFAVNKGWIAKLATNKITIFTGNISPYAFLIHAIVLVAVRKYLAGTALTASVQITAAVGMAITIALSVLYQKIEKSVKSKIKNKI